MALLAQRPAHILWLDDVQVRAVDPLPRALARWQAALMWLDGRAPAVRAVLGDLDVNIVTAGSGQQALIRLLKADLEETEHKAAKGLEAYARGQPLGRWALSHYGPDIPDGGEVLDQLPVAALRLDPATLLVLLAQSLGLALWQACWQWPLFWSACMH